MAFADLVADVDRAAQAHLGGVTVTYQPAVGAPVDVQGMFDERHVLLDAEEGGLETVTPAVFLRLADLPEDPEVDNPTITVGGTAYRVRERQPDGQGGIRLLLHVADVGVA